MQLEENTKIKNLGKHIGFSLGIFIFLSMFYTILKLLHKIPASIRYWHVLILIIVTIIIRLIYVGIKK